MLGIFSQFSQVLHWQKWRDTAALLAWCHPMIDINHPNLGRALWKQAVTILNELKSTPETVKYPFQRAKKVVSDSQGLVDFAIGLVNSVLNLPDGQVKFFEEFKLQKNCEINLLIKTLLGLVEMMFGLVNVSFSLPKWQAVKMTFFAPCFLNG